MGKLELIKLLHCIFNIGVRDSKRIVDYYFLHNPDAVVNNRIERAYDMAALWVLASRIVSEEWEWSYESVTAKKVVTRADYGIFDNVPLYGGE